MALYIVLLAMDGGEDSIYEVDHIPTECEEGDLTQVVGLHFSGCYETDSPEAALEMALAQPIVNFAVS